MPGSAKHASLKRICWHSDTLVLLKDVSSSEEAVAAVLSQLPKAFVEISHVATAHLLLSFSACD